MHSIKKILMEANVTELGESVMVDKPSANQLTEYVERNGEEENSNKLLEITAMEDANEMSIEANDSNLLNCDNMQSTLRELNGNGVDMEVKLLQSPALCNVTSIDKATAKDAQTRIGKENQSMKETDPSTKCYQAIDKSKNAETANQIPPVANESNYFKQDVLEIGRRLWKSDNQQQHYTKGCLWSPDGTCLLVPVHLDGMHIIELPLDLYNTEVVNEKRTVSHLRSAVHVRDTTTVYDCIWYPFMNSLEPSTCCWLSSCQHEPIHMWDAFTGNLVCSYCGYNDVDEVEAAISLLFSHDGEKILAGYKKSIKIFDTNVPGRQCDSLAVKHSVACFATTASSNCVTAGSWNGCIYHYDLRSPEPNPLFVLKQHFGGITWLHYIQKDGNNWHLFSGARRDKTICEWDMRNYTKPIRIYHRNVMTNQRIYFDITPGQQWLISGDTTGILNVWNLQNDKMDTVLQIHADCCNGVNMHPNLPILATSSGQYHFTDNIAMGMEKDPISIEYENALLMLWLGPQDK